MFARMVDSPGMWYDASCLYGAGTNGNTATLDGVVHRVVSAAVREVRGHVTTTRASPVHADTETPAPGGIDTKRREDPCGTNHGGAREHGTEYPRCAAAVKCICDTLSDRFVHAIDAEGTTSSADLLWHDDTDYGSVVGWVVAMFEMSMLLGRTETVVSGPPHTPYIT